MKQYRIGIIDHTKGFKQTPVMRYALGIKEARKEADGVKLHYSQNGKCFVGYSSDDRYEYIVSEV